MIKSSMDIVNAIKAPEKIPGIWLGESGAANVERSGVAAMSANVLFSIVVPVYRAQEYLPCCMKSLLAQTYRNVEIILVDDGSPDACPQLCDAYAAQDARVRVIHKENGGLSSARNAGLDVMSGDYVGFVDSDDWLDYKYINVKNIKNK